MPEVDPTAETTPPQNLVRGLRIVLCLTFIGSTIALIYNICMSAMLPHWTTAYRDGSLPIASLWKIAFEDSLQIPRYCYILNAALALGSLTGATMMWQLRKNGLYFYASAQLLTILVAILLMGRANTQVGNIMLTALFLTYYIVATWRINSNTKQKKQEKNQNPVSETTN